MRNPDLQRHAGRYYGKYAGIVTRNEDDQMLGRIYVQIPSMLGPETEVQARPCFPTSHFFVPAVGDSVWVEFEAGDPRYPIWVGVWYPSGSVPDQAAVSPPENHVIKTPGGHTVEFMDKDGEEKITITHKKNSFVAIDKDGNVILSNDKGSFLHLNSKDESATWMEQHSNLITMSSDGVLIVNKGGVVLNMKDDGLSIMCTGKVEITGKTIAITGDSVGLGAQAMEPTLLGQTFMTMFNTHTHGSAMGPTTPPVVPLTPAALTQAVKVK